MRNLSVVVLAVALTVGCGGDPGAQGEADPMTSAPSSTTTTLPDSGPADAVQVSNTVHPGRESLTERQIEMLDVLEQYLAGWKAKDGDLVATLMTDDAVFEYYEQGRTYTVADGSLQARISAGPYDTMRFFAPRMIYGNRIALTGTVDAVDVEWLSVIRFTSVAGEVLIDKETLFYGG